MTDDLAIAIANAAVPLDQVLATLDLPVRSIPGPLSCPVHKFGQESRPSAQIFPDNHIYCFKCAQQYGPVDVWAAIRGVTLERATEELLARWPIAPEEYARLQRDVTRPRQKPLDSSLFDHLEGFLLEYRHKVPLELYRSWVRKTQEAIVPLSRLATDDQIRQLEHFQNQMRRDFSAAREV